MNVLGGDLEPCAFDRMTGFYRDGYCRTGSGDLGVHVVCAVMTEEFLEFTRSRGNDLVTPQPEWMFPGLEAGDRWWWWLAGGRRLSTRAWRRRSCWRRRTLRRSSSSRSRI